jgi:phage-related tail protein
MYENQAKTTADRLSKSVLKCEELEDKLQKSKETVFELERAKE